MDWEGIRDKAWRRLLKKLDKQGEIDWEEGIADGTFASAKKGAKTLAQPSEARGTKLIVLADGTGPPLGIDVASASPAKVNLIEPLLDQAMAPHVPGRLIYDRAADSDPLRERLARRGVELICPHRRGRTAEHCGDSSTAGSSSGRSAGCKPFAAS